MRVLNRNIRKVALALSLLSLGVLGSFVAGCGGSNNELGNSFTLVGWYPENAALQAGPKFPDIGLLGLNTTLFALPSEAAQVGVQNNLTGETIRMRHITLSYSIAGLMDAPPEQMVTLSGMVGPSNSESHGQVKPNDSDLPGANYDIGNRMLLKFPLFPPDAAKWFRDNAHRLPPSPVTLLITARVTGFTSAADTMQTNSSDLFAYIYPNASSVPGFVPTATPAPVTTSAALPADSIDEEEEEAPL